MSTVALVVVLGFVLFVVLVVVLVVGVVLTVSLRRQRPIRPLRSMAASCGVHLPPTVEDDPLADRTIARALHVRAADRGLEWCP